MYFSDMMYTIMVCICFPLSCLFTLYSILSIIEEGAHTHAQNAPLDSGSLEHFT